MLSGEYADMGSQVDINTCTHAKEAVGLDELVDWNKHSATQWHPCLHVTMQME